MKPPENKAPVFALADTIEWLDLEDAMTACVSYQNAQHGKIRPLMFFAPMTEPANLNAWEPMKTAPENLLVISIERTADATLLKVLEGGKDVLGEIRHAASCPSVSVNYTLPLADVYRQMAEAGILAYTLTKSHKDDPSFFFVRGKAAVLAFDRELRIATRSKPA